MHAFYAQIEGHKSQQRHVATSAAPAPTDAGSADAGGGRLSGGQAGSSWAEVLAASAPTVGGGANAARPTARVSLPPPPAAPPAPPALSQEQKARIEANKAAALARRQSGVNTGAQASRTPQPLAPLPAQGHYNPPPPQLPSAGHFYGQAVHAPPAPSAHSYNAQPTTGGAGGVGQYSWR